MKKPQIIMIVLFAADCGFALAKHGESKGVFDFWTTLFCTAVYVAILWCGGFWD